MSSVSFVFLVWLFLHIKGATLGPVIVGFIGLDVFSDLVDKEPEWSAGE